MRTSTSVRGLALVLGFILLASGCGKDKADFQDLDGQVGAVPGEFNLRLAQIYRDQVDSLQAKISSVAPGLSTELTERFKGADEATDDKGTKLSDLLKAKLPGSESKIVNQQVFKELNKLSGDDGKYFDLVDTEKYLGKSTYQPPILADADVDPEFNRQYYLDMIQWREGMEGISDAQATAATPVVVAVLDTGVFANHEDLTNVMWHNAGGAVGYDASKGVSLAPSEAKDAHGHGTHVAGIIGGQGRNHLGIHGVGYLPGRGGVATQSTTEIMDIKVLNDQGSGTSDMISKGIKWAVDEHWKQKTTDTSRAKQRLILNMSLGGPFEAQDYDFKKDTAGKYIFEDDLINWATSKGDVLIIVAAGNESCGISGKCDLYGQTFKETFYYPCSYKNVLCVAATTHEDKLAGFSNRKGSVGIAAPRYQIVSTLPDVEGGTNASKYGYYSGTSQATPVTAGAAAVLWSLYADYFTASDIKLILQKSSAQIAAVTSEMDSHEGRLDLKAALDYASALKAAGKKPTDETPAAAVATTAETPQTAPPVGDIDPNQTSKDANGDSGPKDLGDGSANGCAVVGLTTHSSVSYLMLALLLALPVVVSVSYRPQSSRAQL